jgi:hypothetical protein
LNQLYPLLFLNFCHAQPVRPPSDLLRLTEPAKPCLNPAKSSNYLGTVRFCFRNKTRICAPEKGLHANISSKPVKKKMPSEELIHSINNQLTILIGRADLLSKAEVNAEAQRACLELKAAAGNLNRLIREYMDKSLANKAS